MNFVAFIGRKHFLVYSISFDSTLLLTMNSDLWKLAQIAFNVHPYHLIEPHRPYIRTAGRLGV
jgi:hypothetical protein